MTKFAIKKCKIDFDFLTTQEYFYEELELSLLTVSDGKRDEIVRISGRIDGNGLIYALDEAGNVSSSFIKPQ